LRAGRPARRVIIEETDVTISADSERDLDRAAEAVRRHRRRLDEYAARHPEFLTAKVPVRVPEEAPKIVLTMARAAELVGVGPMAAVAGSIAELAARSADPTVIVDNGGDVQVRAREPVVVGLYVSEDHPLTGRLGFEVKGTVGVCTSSGRYGHSFSMGDADAVTVFAERASVADAAATAVCNLTYGDDREEAVQRALEFADDLTGDVIDAVLVVHGELVGYSGRLPKLVRIDGDEVRPARLEATI